MSLTASARSKGKRDLLSSGDSLPLKLTLASNQVYGKTGHVILVDRAVTTQTGSLRLAASFANPDNLLRPSQFGAVSAQTELLKDAVLVPQRAVNELQGSYQVVVVGYDGIAHIRPITLGPSAGTSIVIVTCVARGDQVVTEGVDKIKDGIKVTPHTVSPQAPPVPRAQGN